MRGGDLKIKKAGGGLGGRAQRLPPVHSLVGRHSFSCTGVSSVVDEPVRRLKNRSVRE